MQCPQDEPTQATGAGLTREKESHSAADRLRLGDFSGLAAVFSTQTMSQASMEKNAFHLHLISDATGETLNS
ncbi:MAG: hypothetical protein AAGH38_06905, partial [Pseudomonadota bacterium]